MKEYTITLFEGDGIGPEITASFKEIMKALQVTFHYEEFLIGQRAFEKEGVLIPQAAIDSIYKNKVALKAPVTTPIGKGFQSVNVQLRNLFDLYVNLRPALSLPNTLARYENIDIVTFRENTEDLYIGEEIAIEDGFIAYKKITKKCSKRIIRYAFEYCKAHHRKKLCCVHKANILKNTDGLFLDVFNEIKQEYPEIEASDKIVDNMCMQLVMNPNQFDAIVAPNLYGDILTDLISGLIGGLGLAPAANIGKDIAIFEAVHGSAPDIANQNIANPTAFLLSSAMLLDYIKESGKASILRQAIVEVLLSGKTLTKDMGGNATTSEYTSAIVCKIKELDSKTSNV